MLPRILAADLDDAATGARGDTRPEHQRRSCDAPARASAMQRGARGVVALRSDSAAVRIHEQERIRE